MAVEDPLTPPDGETVVSGVWGVDMVYDTTTVAVGESSVRFINQSSLASPAFPAIGGEPHTLEVLVASGSSGLGVAFATVEWGDAVNDAGEITSTVGPAATLAQSVDPFTGFNALSKYVLAPSGARFARIVYGKQSTTGDDVFFNMRDLRPAPHFATAVATGLGATFGATTEIVPNVNPTVYGPALSTLIPRFSVFIRRSAPYLLRAWADAAAPAGGPATITLRLRVRPRGGSVAVESLETIELGAGDTGYLEATKLKILNWDDEVSISIQSDNASAIPNGAGFELVEKRA